MKIVLNLHQEGSVLLIPEDQIDKDFIDAVLISTQELEQAFMYTKEMFLEKETH